MQSLFRWIKKIFLLLEIFFFSGFFRAAILLMPFKKLKNFMGTPGKESCFEISKDNLRKVLIISRYIERISMIVPWESKCLVQALTAQYMLRRRGIESTLYLGLNKEAKGNLQAHSWLRCGDLIVTGEAFMDRYKEISKFTNINTNKGR